MPKQTFYNLPEDKKERVMDAAIDEFAKHTYHKASITRIVNKADIAKGSFYQYFEDKKDLYKHIVELGGQKKLECFSHVIANAENMNFFQIIKEIYVSGIKLSKEYPRLTSIGYKLMESGNDALRKEIFGENLPKSNEFFEGLLVRGIEKGEINPDINISFVAYTLTSLSISIGEYFYTEVKVSDDSELLDLVDDMLFVIENGIKKHN